MCKKQLTCLPKPLAPSFFFPGTFFGRFGTELPTLLSERCLEIDKTADQSHRRTLTFAFTAASNTLRESSLGLRDKFAQSVSEGLEGLSAQFLPSYVKEAFVGGRMGCISQPKKDEGSGSQWTLPFGAGPVFWLVRGKRKGA